MAKVLISWYVTLRINSNLFLLGFSLSYAQQVVWTKKAECQNAALSNNCAVNEDTEDKMHLLIALAVSETNAAFQMSNVNTELNLVHSYRHTHNEQGDPYNWLRELRLHGDIRTQRLKHGADIVSMIVGTTDFCGLGYIGPHKEYMYSISSWNCATGYFSFGHEIGKVQMQENSMILKLHS